MAQPGAPRRREQNVSGTGKDIYKRGDGLGTGPVGSGKGAGRPGSSPSYRGESSERSGGGVRSGGGSKLILIIIAVVVLLGGGGGLSGLFSGLLGGGGSDIGGDIGGGGLSSLLEGFTSFSGSNTSTGWDKKSNTGTLDTKVAAGARDKYTELKGSGKDKVTILVYMCGTDLESRSGMATSDLNEMKKATLSSNVNLIIYTGGCSGWKTSGISNTVNQIYKIENGRLNCLEENMGKKAMTNSSTLQEFLEYGKKNYKANRTMLIFWDHGGGSLSGYGYDEKYSGSGSMTLADIDKTLAKVNMKFDIIGFDACLMATAENALMLSKYADYMVASEETEPGVGWYYTNWLTELSKNTSLSSLQIGKKIADDFVDECARSCAGQKTTLSVIDLAEFSATVPEELSDFALSTSDLICKNSYAQVAEARSGAREFASSNKIDQVDLIHLAYNMDTQDGTNLAKALLSAVKYNRTSSNMTNAYGVSIYFPYKRTSNVDSAVDAYESLGMDSDYMRCIQQFASAEVSGQAVSSGSSSALPSLLGSLGSLTGNNSSPDLIGSVLSGLLGGNLSGIGSITDSLLGRDNIQFLQNSPDRAALTDYLYKNAFDSSKLVWKKVGGKPQISLTAEQWKLVQNLELNVFVDDGEGYIDLGFDNIYDFTDEGALLGNYGKTWLAINGQPVAYYYQDTVDDGKNYTITGYVPVLVNDSRAQLLLVFDNAHPYGYVAGVRSVYTEGETATVAKEALELENGDLIDFLCDYYSYSGEYLDSYKLGDQMTYHGKLEVSDVDISRYDLSAMYRFTDIYNSCYWTPEIPD